MSFLECIDMQVLSENPHCGFAKVASVSVPVYNSPAPDSKKLIFALLFLFFLFNVFAIESQTFHQIPQRVSKVAEKVWDTNLTNKSLKTKRQHLFWMVCGYNILEQVDELS